MAARPRAVCSMRRSPTGPAACRSTRYSAALEAAEVPAGRIYSVADIVADPHYQARDMLLNAELPGGVTVKMPGIVPEFSQTPRRGELVGSRTGPAHRTTSLRNLGLTVADINA